jgi:hypothetical protein
LFSFATIISISVFSFSILKYFISDEQILAIFYFFRDIHPRLTIYLFTDLSLFTYLQFVAFQLVIIFLILYKRMVNKSNNQLFNILILSAFLLPISSLDPTLFRIFRNLLILFYFYLSNSKNSFNQLSIKITKLLVFIIALLASINFFILDERILYNVFFPIFNYNYFLTFSQNNFLLILLSISFLTVLSIFLLNFFRLLKKHILLLLFYEK